MTDSKSAAMVFARSFLLIPRINRIKGQYKAVLATGVAGNEDAGYLMRTMVRIDGEWQIVTINNQEATGLLSPDDVRALLTDGGSDIHEFAPPQWLFVSAAERINENLHRGAHWRRLTFVGELKEPLPFFGDCFLP